MRTLSVLGRTMAALALMAGVLLTAGGAAWATPGIDPFAPIAVGAGPPAGSSGGGSSSATTPTTTAGSGGSTGGTSTGTATTPTTTPSAPTQGATGGSGGTLPFTGSHTLSTFLLGLFAITVGMPLVRAGRRRWDARHWPAC